MKKHFKAYAEGFAGAKELRMKLMETHNAQEIEDIIEDFIRTSGQVSDAQEYENQKQEARRAL